MQTLSIRGLVQSACCALPSSFFSQDSVVVVGYPVGGDSISVTKGVVSRVDMRCGFFWLHFSSYSCDQCCVHPPTCRLLLGAGTDCEPRR